MIYLDNYYILFIEIHFKNCNNILFYFYLIYEYTYLLIEIHRIGKYILQTLYNNDIRVFLYLYNIV